jgi:tRNA threonylcarbamoyl adenosine modification protein YeaZ
MATQKNNFSNSLILALETSGRMGSVALAQGQQLLGESAFSGPTRPGVGAAKVKEGIDVLNTSSAIEREGTLASAQPFGEAGSSRSRMRHSAEVFPAIVGLLSRFGKKPNQIEQVYISVGPGSFTGLRIAVTIAKTMALANQAKIVAVDTLDCIAANVINFAAAESPQFYVGGLNPDERLATILDAKRSQFFIAVYEQSEIRNPKSKIDFPLIKVLPDSLMTADEFLDRFTDKPVALIGEGLVYYKDKFIRRGGFAVPNVRVLDENFWNPSAANVYRLGWQMALQNQFADPLTLSPNYLRGPDVHPAT